ncbi:hypothetical protein N9B43_00860 [Mariniblastus sp.]|nr:hypothetical protein [Mariniblastus sp.]
MSSSSNAAQFKQLDSRIKSTWRRNQVLQLVSGLLNFCRWAVPLFVLAVAIDWMTSLPSAARHAVLAGLLAVGIYKAWNFGWRNLRRFNATHTALLLEKHHGGMESLLVSAVQLRGSNNANGTSTAMRERTLQLAEESAVAVNPKKAVPFGKLKYPALVVLGLGILIATFSILNTPFATAGMKRILAPWLVAAYPTYTHLQFEQGDLIVKEGETANITVGVSGIVPSQAKLFLSTGQGRPREIELDIADGNCQYTIASASRDFRYRIKAGDARSNWHEVRVIPAPRIENVQVGLEYPKYLQRDSDTIEALTLTVPESTTVHWDLTLDRPIRDPVLHRDGETPLPLTVSDDGLNLVIDEQVEASRGYSFSWVEKEHGFDFVSPRYYLQVAADQPPRVELTSPESNVNALLGRQLDLAVRARDDHGIGEMKITYGVNLRPTKSVALAVSNDDTEGEQTINWDYRDVLPDLKVGDTVSFVIEVADRYPTPDGPHQAISDTRRITFLTREEYLAQIAKKTDRLLTRVRTSYRQERAAHTLVNQLDPQSDTYLQTCQLEAIRQEMLRQQLNEIAIGVQDLLDDLKANNVSDAVESDTLVRVREGLTTIAETQVAKAASLLREQTGAAENGTLDPTPATQVVNQAARELADLVLQRGIDFAREVLARESRMLAQEQAALRLLAIQSKQNDPAEVIAKRQEELAVWTDHLIESLRNGMRYDKRPISVLGLTRRIKELRSTGAEEKMKTAASLMRDGRSTELAPLPSEIIAAFLSAEFSMRTGAEYAAIIEFRSRLNSLLQRQQKLRKQCEALSDDNFPTGQAEMVATQSEIQAALVTSLLPPVPTPRARLFDSTFPQPLPVEQLRSETEQTMAEALKQLKSGERKLAIEGKLKTEEKMIQFSELLEFASLELSLRAQGLNSLVSTASERVTRIEDFEERQIDLLERTEEAALDEVNSESLAEEQQFLMEEISEFKNELLGNEGADQDALPLLSQLEVAANITKSSLDPLKSNTPEEALELQEEAADALALALEISLAQSDRLMMLQDLYSFQRSVGDANGWMKDIVDEQTDLVESTRSAKPEDAPKLIPVMTNLRQCYTDIAPILDLVAGRLDAGTPLLFAGTDLEDAILGVEDGDFIDATDAQEVAAESLAEVRVLVDAVQRQTGYVAEIVEFLHATQADAASMAFQQEQLKKRLVLEKSDISTALTEQQRALQQRAEIHGRKLVTATGMITFAGPATQMLTAAEMLKSGNADAALGQMELAEETLKINAEELLLIITMLHGLPSIEVTSASAEELVLLLDILSLASDQRDLARESESAKPAELKALANRQDKLKTNIKKAITGDTPDPKLVAANEAIIEATKTMQDSNPEGTRRNHELANDALRHFVIEQALILETAKGVSASSDEPVLTESETTDLSLSVANFVSDFVSGEAPKDKKTEWEVLGERERAALNQNFARELPLEYRGTLKNYYERVAK